MWAVAGGAAGGDDVDVARSSGGHDEGSHDEVGLMSTHQDQRWGSASSLTEQTQSERR